LPTYVGDREPTLVRLQKPDLRHVGDFWLLGHGDLRDNARLRAARERISAALTERSSLFRGGASPWHENAPVRPELATSDRWPGV
jgi:hypothetical protein